MALFSLTIPTEKKKMARTTVLILTVFYFLSPPSFADNKSCIDCGAKESSKTPMIDLTLAVASKKNAVLVKTARWTFGRPQTGFLIYIPLIQQTIGSDADYDTAEFARALKQWQLSKGYENANGILDVQAFLFLKEQWQADRKTQKASTQPMTSIAPTFRYDPKREEEYCQIGEKTYVAYQKMVEAARKEGITGDDLKIVSSNRDPARLKQIQKSIGDKKKLGFTIAAKNSVHFTGRALDLYVGGEPVSTKDSNRMIQVKSKAYQWLLKNAGRFGFKNYFYEPWHWEYVDPTNDP